MRLFLTIFLLLMVCSAGWAGEVRVVAATAEREAAGTYRFAVTLEHADTGWDHYADRWEILSPQGELLATRTLYHPHEQEQPFTRSLSGVKIPTGMASVLVRGHDSVHGDGVSFEIRIKKEE